MVGKRSTQICFTGNKLRKIVRTWKFIMGNFMEETSEQGALGRPFENTYLLTFTQSNTVTPIKESNQYHAPIIVKTEGGGIGHGVGILTLS